MAAVLLPLPLQISGGDRDLVAGSADDGVIRDPIRIGREQIEAFAGGVAARRHLDQGPEVLFAPAAGIVQFEVRVVSDLREILDVEEGPVVGELGLLVPVAEPMRGVRNAEGERGDFSRRERLVEGIDRIHVPGRPAHEVKRAIELDVRHGLVRVGDVDLCDRRAALVLEREPP